MPPPELTDGSFLWTIGGILLFFAVLFFKLLGDFLAWNYRRKQEKISRRNSSLTRTGSSQP